MDFFIQRNYIQSNQAILEVWERLEKHAYVLAFLQKSMGKTFNDDNQTIKQLNKIRNIFSGSSSTTSKPNFKCLCNSIPELSNVFEDLVQHIHTKGKSNEVPSDLFSVLQMTPYSDVSEVGLLVSVFVQFNGTSLALHCH